MPRWPRLARYFPLLVGLLLSSIPPARATLAAISTPTVAVTRTPDATTLRVADLGPMAGARSAVTPPFQPRHAAAYARAKAQASRGPVLNVASQVPVDDQPRAPSGSTEQVVVGFPGMSYSQQISLLGGDQATEPPDTQIAAGPSSLVMVVNTSGSVWTRSGTLTKSFDLSSFFGIPSGYYFGDPRVLYDAPSGRWFISGLSFDLRLDSQAYVATSTSSDPTGTWHVFTVASNASRTLYDQPKLGVSDDKVVMSWSSYGNGASSYLGQETSVLQKSDLLAGRAAATKTFGPDVNHFDVVPTQALSATTTAYAVYNNADPALSQTQGFPSLGVIAITGTPAQGNVTWSEWDLPARATSAPPAAAQPGTVGEIETNDDRLLSAVWQNGILWTSGNDACVPTGDNAQRACLRLFQVSTAAPTPSLLQDFDVGVAGADLYFPGVTMTGRGDVFAGFTESSSTVYASAATAAQLTTDPAGSLGAIQIVAHGLGTYTCGGACGGGPMRWGDYSGASPDATDPASAWIAGEFAASGQNGADWGTGIARVGNSGALAVTPTPTGSDPPGAGNPPPAVGTPRAYLPSISIP